MYSYWIDEAKNVTSSYMYIIGFIVQINCDGLVFSISNPPRAAFMYLRNEFLQLFQRILE